MSSTEQFEETRPTAPPLAQVPALKPACVGARASGMGALLLYAMLPVVWLLGAVLSAEDPLLALLASMATLAVVWVAAIRVKPRAVAFEAGLVLTLAYLNRVPFFSSTPLAVLWIAAAVAAGLVGAALTRRNAGEDHFFFLPLLTAVLSFALLVGVGLGGGWREALAGAARLVQAMQGEIELQISQIQRYNQNAGVLWQEFWTELKPHFALYNTVVVMALWTLGLWGAGRLARHRLGLLWGHRAGLMMFQIRQRYIFLLILGLILEIFIVLSKREALQYLAWPILAVFALACFFEGLGVIFFWIAVRRMFGHVRSAPWLKLIGVLALLALPQAGVLLGLADIWFDFRKLERLRGQPEAHL